MAAFVPFVRYFQSKIANYDKQSAEQSVEHRILQDIESDDVQKNKTFLIDVDVVRGSIFTKNKPRHGWSQAVYLGTLRSAFAPFYWNYWFGHTSHRWTVYIMFHFFLQFIQAVCFLLIDPDTSNCCQDDVIVPFMLAICLGILHSHITASHGSIASSSPIASESEIKSALFHTTSLNLSSTASEIHGNAGPSESVPSRHSKPNVGFAQSEVHPHRRVRLPVGDVNHLLMASECFSDIDEGIHCSSSSCVPPHELEQRHRLVSSTGLVGHSNVSQDPINPATLSEASNVLHNKEKLFRDEDIRVEHRLCAEHSDVSDWDVISEEDEVGSEDSAGISKRPSVSHGQPSCSHPGVHSAATISITRRRHDSSCSKFHNAQSPRGHGADGEESDADDEDEREARTSLKHPTVPLSEYPESESEIIGNPLFSDHIGKLNVDISNDLSPASILPEQVNRHNIILPPPATLENSYFLRIPKMKSASKDICQKEPTCLLETVPARSNDLATDSTDITGEMLTDPAKPKTKVRSRGLSSLSVDPSIIACHSRGRSLSVDSSVKVIKGSPFFYVGRGIAALDLRISPWTDDQQHSCCSCSDLGSSSTAAVYSRSLPEFMDKLGLDCFQSGGLLLRKTPICHGAFCKHPRTCQVQSSAVTESFETSPSSATCRLDFPCSRTGRLVDNYESVHGVGAGLDANPKSSMYSADTDPSAETSLSKTCTHLRHIKDDRFRGSPTSSSCLSKSFVDLTDQRRPLHVCSTHPIHLVPQLNIETCPVVDGHEDNSELLSASESKRNSDCWRRLNGCTETEEDTITTHSRQRAKFLRLFLQRACLVEPHQRRHPPSTQPQGEFCFGKFSKGIKKDRIFRSTNVLNDSMSNTQGASMQPSKIRSRRVKDARLIRFDTRNVAATCKSVQPDDSYNNTSFTHERRTAPGGNQTSHHAPSNYWSSANMIRRPSFSTRGQTASETEYDRINSDVGSDIDSSSSPDDVEPLPTPPAKCSNQFSSWKSESQDQPARVANSARQSTKDSQRITVKKARGPRRVRHSSSISSNLRLPKTAYAGSSEDSTGFAGADQLWMEQDPITDSDLFGESHRQPDISLSNAEDAARPINPKCSSSLWKDVSPDDRHACQPSGPNASLLFSQKPSIPESLPKAWSSRSFALPDTVRCYLWDGDRLSKLNLTMLDIGYNVIRAVERQGISADYIILASIATLCLPLLSVAFHWNGASTPVANSSIFTPPSTVNNRVGGSTFTPLFTHPSIEPSEPPTYLLADSILAMHLRVVWSLIEKVFIIFSQPVQWMAMLLRSADVVSGDSTRIGLLDLLRGRGFFQWLYAPDLQGRLVMILAVILRLNIYGIIFFLLCIAELTFQQRLLYAKYFFSLTSARRARKYRVPQFRLNKLSHIKTWLTLRSYLKKRGPQRSVETAIAAAFYIVFIFGLALCSQLISHKEGNVFSKLTNWDVLGLTLALMVFLHRFIILGTKITKKYRNFSVLITEQINLYLSMEKKPHKKEELMATFQVLRLVEGLLKEVDGPFRVCGWTVNPLVYNIFKLVLLSCFSSLLSETLGFKLKLYKLKLNAANW